MTFIGRWSPFHKGHTAIIKKKVTQHPQVPILILVRNTTTDSYTPQNRAEYIKIWMQKKRIKGTVMIVPNIEGVYWGRGVGYRVEQVDVDENTKKISATKIREGITKRDSNWKRLVAHESTANLLSQKTSEITQTGLVVWLTGCPSSGKTTISHALIKKLAYQYPHLKTQFLDGDIMRSSPVAAHIGFSKQERADHIRRMAYLASMFADHGILVICAFVSPDRKIREEAQKIIGKHRFIEVFVDASLKTRIKRDAKGLYKKAMKGQIPNLTGYNEPYQQPKNPNVVCNTDELSIKKSVERIMAYIFQ